MSVEGEVIMATTTTTAAPIRTAGPVDDQCVELRDVGWKGYATLLRLRRERPRPKMIYLDGNLWLVTTPFFHEFIRKRLGSFVLEVVVGLEIPCAPSGETTFRRRSKRGGVEGDETYYLANEARVRGKKEIDLRVDPPPDLAIEVVHTHAAEASIEVYRRLGVPEVWIWEDGRLRILIRRANGRYAESAASEAFPFLPATEVAGWISRPQDASETQWTIDLRRWVRDTLAPRVQDHARPGPEPEA